MGLFRRRASADEALDLERAWQLIQAARLGGQLRPECPRCGYPELTLSPVSRYSRALAALPAPLRGALVHPSSVRGYVVACARCEAGFAAVTMGRATP